MSDWNLFVREVRAGNFRGTRSFAMRYYRAEQEADNLGGNPGGELI